MLCVLMYFFKPASPTPPAGSATVRLVSKISLIAAQISSVETVIMSSTTALAGSKGVYQPV